MRDDLVLIPALERLKLCSAVCSGEDAEAPSPYRAGVKGHEEDNAVVTRTA